MQSNDQRETYGYETNKVLVIEKEQIKFSNITNNAKKENFAAVGKENIK